MAETTWRAKLAKARRMVAWAAKKKKKNPVGTHKKGRHHTAFFRDKKGRLHPIRHDSNYSPRKAKEK